MALDSYNAEQFAQRLMLALAETGKLEVKGSGQANSTESGSSRAEIDAAYLGSLYRELVNEFQK